MPRFRSMLALIAFVLGCSAAGHGPLEVPTAPGKPWLPDIGPPLALEQAEIVAMAEHVRARLAQDSQKQAAAHAEHAGLPPRLAQDQAPRVVWVSVARQDRPAAVALGTGQGMAAALDEAAHALEQMGVVAGPSTQSIIKFDIATHSEPAQMLRWGDDLGLEPGVYGVAFARGSRLALLGEELIARELVAADGGLRRARVAAYVAERGPGSEAVARILAHRGPMPVYRFRTASVAVRGPHVVRLVRGHRQDIPITPTELRAAVAAGAAYLARAVGQDGRFVYHYRSARDQADDSYNMVRHAGTVFAMLQAWQLGGQPELRAAAERALGYLARFVEPFAGPPLGAAAPAGDMAVVAFRGKIKLGGVALAALAMITHAELTGARTYVPLAQQLCRYIRASQRPDGSFLHQRQHPSGRPLGFISQYYPGEALLALVSMHRLDGDAAWLDTAEAGARYLIEVRDRGLTTAELTHDHWLLYALSGLYRQRPRDLYLEHALRIVQAIQMTQRGVPGQPDAAADFAGSFAIDPDDATPRSTPVATRSEGLMAAYALARGAGRHDVAHGILATVQRAARFQLFTQIDAIRAMYLPNPAAALGGFGHSLHRLHIRIDYVQHNLSALIALIEALEGRSP